MFASTLFAPPLSTPTSPSSPLYNHPHFQLFTHPQSVPSTHTVVFFQTIFSHHTRDGWAFATRPLFSPIDFDLLLLFLLHMKIRDVVQSPHTIVIPVPLQIRTVIPMALFHSYTYHPHHSHRQPSYLYAQTQQSAT